MSWEEYLRQHGCGGKDGKAHSYSSRHSSSGRRCFSRSRKGSLKPCEESVFTRHGMTFVLDREGRYLTLRVRDNQGYEGLIQLTDREWETVLEIVPRFLAVSSGT
jgi:hypothetical protein